MFSPSQLTGNKLFFHMQNIFVNTRIRFFPVLSSILRTHLKIFVKRIHRLWQKKTNFSLYKKNQEICVICIISIFLSSVSWLPNLHPAHFLRGWTVSTLYCQSCSDQMPRKEVSHLMLESYFANRDCHIGKDSGSVFPCVVQHNQVNVVFTQLRISI